jgi:hypothetical protein
MTLDTGPMAEIILSFSATFALTGRLLIFS